MSKLVKDDFLKEPEAPPPPPVAPAAASTAAAAASVAAAKAKPAPPPCPPEYRGTKTYVLTEKYYNNLEGRMYAAGETVTVVDTVPGRTWVPA